jgi:hypothetical protein
LTAAVSQGPACASSGAFLDPPSGSKAYFRQDRFFWGQAIPQVKLRRRLDLARNAERAVDGVPGLIAERWVDAKLT